LGIFGGILRKGKVEQKFGAFVRKTYIHTYIHVFVFIVEVDSVLCEVRAAARDRFGDLKIGTSGGLL
jgi:hypothetical protein